MTNSRLSSASIPAAGCPPAGPYPSSGEMPTRTRDPTGTPARPDAKPLMTEPSSSTKLAGFGLPKELSNSVPSRPLTPR